MQCPVYLVGIFPSVQSVTSIVKKLSQVKYIYESTTRDVRQHQGENFQTTGL